MKWALIFVVMYTGRFGIGWNATEVTTFPDSKSCESAVQSLKNSDSYKNGHLHCQEEKNDKHN